MKKTLFLLPILLLITGCGVNKNTVIHDEDIPSQDVETKKLQDPKIEWCELYNPNGFDTLTCILSNPNNKTIDSTFDIVYYKDGKEVRRNEGYYIDNLTNSHNAVLWTNSHVPEAKDVDEVKLEDISVTESYYTDIKATIKETSKEETIYTFDVKHDSKPVMNTIYFLLYNDKNNNKKCDKDEIVVVDMNTSFDQNDKVSFDASSYEYTNYEIYYNAYK